MTPCSHDGFHSGLGRYSPDTQQLRYVVVCDDCQQELREVLVQEYRPQFEPNGNEGRSA
jgi:hypothetical protein